VVHLGALVGVGTFVRPGQRFVGSEVGVGKAGLAAVEVEIERREERVELGEVEGAAGFGDTVLAKAHPFRVGQGDRHKGTVHRPTLEP